MICHGQGNRADGFNGGCCFVNGEVCPVRRYDPTPGGRTYICTAAEQAVEVDPSIVGDRERFSAAWFARPEYQPIADAWESIGLPRDYCQTYGPAEGQCCFAEDQATNSARSVTLRGRD